MIQLIIEPIGIQPEGFDSPLIYWYPKSIQEMAEYLWLAKSTQQTVSILIWDEYLKNWLTTIRKG